MNAPSNAPRAYASRRDEMDPISHTNCSTSLAIASRTADRSPASHCESRSSARRISRRVCAPRSSFSKWTCTATGRRDRLDASLEIDPECSSSGCLVDPDLPCHFFEGGRPATPTTDKPSGGKMCRQSRDRLLCGVGTHKDTLGSTRAEAAACIRERQVSRCIGKSWACRPRRRFRGHAPSGGSENRPRHRQS